jgi:hypothetical protein
MSFRFGDTALSRFLSNLYGILIGVRQSDYPCITCLLSDEGNTSENGLNNPFRNKQ